MEIRNYTPFVPFFFKSRDKQQQNFGVLVIRGTFRISPSQSLKPLAQQHPFVASDIYFGEIGK